MKGFIHYNLLEHGMTITADLYWQPLDWVNEILSQKGTGLIKRKGILQHDNAEAHYRNNPHIIRK